MTKLNWDRVNMENLAARREDEIRNRLSEPEKERVGLRQRLKSLGSRVVRKLARRTEPAYNPLRPLQPLRCTQCGNNIAAASMAKHIKKKHSRKMPPGADIEIKKSVNLKLDPLEESSKSRPKPASQPSLVPTKKKRKKKGKQREEERRNSVDIIYTKQYLDLAMHAAVCLRNDQLSVRLIQSGGRRKAVTEPQKIKWYIKSHEDILRVSSLDAELRFLGMDSDRIRVKNKSQPIGVIYLTGPRATL